MTVSEKKKNVPCHISTQKTLQPSSYHIAVAWRWALKELRAETGCLVSVNIKNAYAILMERDKNQEVSWNIYMIQWGRKFWATTLGIFSATGLWCVYVKVTESCLTLSNPRQSMEFSRPEYWRGLPFPSLGDLPDPGIEPGLPHCSQIRYHLSHQGEGNGSPLQYSCLEKSLVGHGAAELDMTKQHTCTLAKCHRSVYIDLDGGSQPQIYTPIIFNFHVSWRVQHQWDFY